MSREEVVTALNQLAEINRQVPQLSFPRMLRASANVGDGLQSSGALYRGLSHLDCRLMSCLPLISRFETSEVYIYSPF